MTLIVGIKCTDGIVLAADGAATMGSMGQHTAIQSTKKLYSPNASVIVGVSGTVGLAQRIQGTIGGMYSSGQFASKSLHDAMGIIRKRIWDDIILGEMVSAQVAQSVVGSGVAQSSALCGSLIAIPIAKELCLIELDQQAAPGAATEDLPFVAIGSGQATADPFLAFLRRIFWKNKMPSMSEGMMTAWWTLHHAISTSPGGVANPKQFMTLRMDGKTAVAREIPDVELQETQQFVLGAEEYLKKFGGPTIGVPPIPQPPAAPPAPAAQ